MQDVWDDVEGAARHVGHHAGPVCGLALDLGRTRVGVPFGPRDAARHQVLLHLENDVAVLGVDQRRGAKLGAAAERVEHLGVVDHQGALVGHEVLEGIDAALDDLAHLGLDLIRPPRHGHVVGVVATGDLRLLVPLRQRLHERLALGGQAEVDEEGGAAGECRAGAGLVVVGGERAHEGHLHMGMRVDPARHDEAAVGVDGLGACRGLEVGADGGDPAVVPDQHVGARLAVGVDDGAALDEEGHGGFSLRP